MRGGVIDHQMLTNEPTQTNFRKAWILYKKNLETLPLEIGGGGVKAIKKISRGLFFQ